MDNDTVATVTQFPRAFKRSRGAKARKGDACPVIPIGNHVVSPEEQDFMDQIVEIFTREPMLDGTIMSEHRATQLALAAAQKIREIKRSRV